MYILKCNQLYFKTQVHRVIWHLMVQACFRKKKMHNFVNNLFIVWC